MLHFRFADLISEGNAFVEMTGSTFFLPSELEKLKRYVGDIEYFSRSRANSHVWEVVGISTKVSEGEYEVDDNGKNVYGTVSSIWDLKRVNEDVFEIPEKASTRLKIFDLEDNEIACWTMDIATKLDDPGCHFHSQVKDWSVCIPRFPGIAVSPFSAFEFLLSELFQKKWVERSGKPKGGIAWRRIQLKRLQALLAWTTAQIEIGNTSPWVAYKSAKPASSIFL